MLPEKGDSKKLKWDKETRGRKPNTIKSEKMGLSIPGPLYKKLLKRAGIKTAVAQEIYKILAKEFGVDLNEEK